jgi:lipopolysaccharide export system permease protein
MSRILHRYIFSEIVRYFLICLFAFTTLLLTVRMLKFAGLIINKGVAFSQIGMVFLSIIPTFLELAIPMATLLGVMLAFARLSGDSEIIVVRAAGIGLKQLVPPVALFGLLTAILAVWVSLNWKPWGFNKLAETLFQIARSKSTSGLNEGVFNPVGQLMIYADKIDYQTGGLGKTIIEDRRNELEPRIFTARNGRILSDAQSRSINFLLFDGQIHEQVRAKYITTDFMTNSLSINSDELFEDDSKKEKKFRMMTTKELEEYAVTQDALGKEVEKTGKIPADLFDKKPDEAIASIEKRKVTALIERAKRYSTPFAAFVLALLAMPLGIQQPRAQRTWGAGLSVVIGLLSFAVYFAFVTVGSTVAEAGLWSAEIGAWLANLLLFLIALWMITRMHQERWQSVTQALDDFLKRWGPRFWRRRKSS